MAVNQLNVDPAPLGHIPEQTLLTQGGNGGPASP